MDLNRAVNDIFYQLYMKKIGLLEEAVRLLRKIVIKPTEEEIENKIDRWALAIQEYEGWFPPSVDRPDGSLTWRTNNPGALRWSRYESDNRNGFSVFKDYETGLKALKFQLQIAVDGRSKVYNPEMTLLQFFEKYAPYEDSNDSKKYAKFVADRLNVSIGTKIKELV